MSALAVRVAHAAAAAPPGAGLPPAAQHDTGFAALLGKMADPKPSAAGGLADGAAKSKGETKPSDNAPAAETTASTLTALQSLEAALSGFGALTPPSASTPPTRTALQADPRSATTQATGNAAALGSALATVAGALDGSGPGAAWDSSGKTPLKALLQADPTLGLSDFQMKTHLGAVGATPARAGSNPLGINATWGSISADPLAKATDSSGAAAPNPAKTATTGASPLPTPPSAPAAAAAAGSEAPPAAALDAFAPSLAAAPRAPAAAASPSPSSRANVQTRASTHGSPARSSHGAAPTPIAFASAASAVAPSAASADVGARRDEAAGGSSAANAATNGVPMTADAAATPTLTVPLALLPAFIAEQVDALAADAPSATDSAAPAAQAKAAQAVKELNIALDPADLGQMTLKLRLAGGKLSVTIDVANPQTLAAIEGDRALIASRILSGDQTLDDLVIQRQAPTASTPETVSAHASSRDRDSSSSDPQSQSGDSGHPQGAPPRRGGGGAFSDLLV